MLHVHEAIQRRVFLIIFLFVTNFNFTRNGNPRSSHLTPLHPILTSNDVLTVSANQRLAQALPMCNSPQPNGDTQAALFQLAAALGSLGFRIHRQETPRHIGQPPNYGAFADDAPLQIPIPIKSFLLFPGVPVDSAVANSHGQRLAQPLPPAMPAVTNPPLSARPELDPVDRDLLLKSANALESRSHPASASEHNWKTP